MAKSESYANFPQGTKQYKDPFQSGVIGSEAGRDLMEPAPARIYTKPYSAGETRDTQCHGAEYTLREAGVTVKLTRYADLDHQSRVAPMPMAAQDEGFLRIGVADSEMTDSVRGTGIPPEQVYKNDLFGENKDGVAHNEGHPGFAAVQKKIQGEGYSAKAAGAILASKTRSASKAAHKANPRLNRVKG